MANVFVNLTVEEIQTPDAVKERIDRYNHRKI